jgi:aminocarboxymuconate-semialdehyde decarboxylase
MKADRRNFLKTGAVVGAGSLLGAAPAVAAIPAAPDQSSLLGKSFAERAEPRMWTKPQRPSPPVSIDIHTHWSPAAYLKVKADLGQPDNLPPINHDMAQRLASMQKIGIRTSVISLGGFRPWGWIPREIGNQMARDANDAALAAHQAYPQNYIAGIEVNCSDPVASLAELNRMAGKPGMVCLHLPTSLAGRDFMFEPAFEPIFARCQALGLPILLHPLDGEANWFAGKRLVESGSGVAPGADFKDPSNRFPGLTNSLGNSLEMAVCMSKLIVSGTLDRYPELVIIATAGGGALPYVGGRLENRGGSTKLAKPLHTYLRRFYYDSLTYWPDSLRYLVEMVGPDRVVLGTDNMYSPGYGMQQPHSLIDQCNFAESDRDLILRGNLTRLFKL